MDATDSTTVIPPRLDLRPGDLVEIRREDEIRETLDETGTLDALPFMPEMIAYCGKRARVFRRVEKVWDMTGGTGLRRLRDTVLLDGLRCDGAHHDGCQAGCHLLWKEAWLRPIAEDGTARGDLPTFSAHDTGSAALGELITRRDRHDGPRYMCQATELPRAAGPMRQADPRHFLRELTVRNVGPGQFVEGVAIELFNRVQRRRGGAGYPQLTPCAASPTPHAELDLRPGEMVIVKSKSEIEATLDERRRNRGLYFDQDMIRYCGGSFRVLRRVERLIDERTGRMSVPRYPCIVLDGVVATGEYHAFRAQNEFILWREIWLRRANARVELPGAGSIP
jgi:hypothetical protein